MENIVLHVTYTGEPGDARKFVSEANHALRALALAEDGCLQYDYFLPVSDMNSALLLEKWRDQQALSAHISGKVMEKIRECKAGYNLETTIERYE